MSERFDLGFSIMPRQGLAFLCWLVFPAMRANGVSETGPASCRFFVNKIICSHIKTLRHFEYLESEILLAKRGVSTSSRKVFHIADVGEPLNIQSTDFLFVEGSKQTAKN
jgi:hypothetical protein